MEWPQKSSLPIVSVLLLKKIKIFKWYNFFFYIYIFFINPLNKNWTVLWDIFRSFRGNGFITRYPSIHPSIHPSFHSSIHPSIHPSIYHKKYSVFQKKTINYKFCNPQNTLWLIFVFFRICIRSYINA